MNKRSFLIIAALFSGASLLLYPHLKFSFNPDALAYLRIASYYQKGEWSQAVNAYWSPLLSWLLCPFFAIGLPWLTAYHIINFIVALAGLGQLARILHRHFADLSLFARNALLLVFSALLLYQQFTTVTSDLLTLCLLFFLVDAFLSGEFFTHPIRTGLLGALLFFSKSYCFFFFLAITGLYVGWLVLRQGLRRLPFLPLLLLVLSFGLPSVGWLTITHAKYGVWQVSGAAAYNYNNINGKGVIKHPYNEDQRLAPLPYPGAFCLWEDPQLTYHYSTAKGRARWPLSWWYGRLPVISAGSLRKILSTYGLGWTLLLPLVAWLLSLYRGRSLYSGSYVRLAFFTALYVSGYMLILVVDRYVWLALYSGWIFLIKAAEWLVLPGADRTHPNAGRVRTGRALVGVLTVYGLFTILRPLPGYFNYGRAEDTEGRAIAAAIPPGSTIAAWNSLDLWVHPFCQYDVHDYGAIAAYGSWPELQADLRVYPVRYIVLTDTADISKVPADISAHLTPVTRSGNWSLYSINQ